MLLYRLSTIVYKVCIVTVYAFFVGFVATLEPILAFVIAMILVFCWVKGVFP